MELNMECSTSLAIYGVRLHAHALFSLGLWFFLIAGLLGISLSHVWQLVIAGSHVQNFSVFL